MKIFKKLIFIIPIIFIIAVFLVFGFLLIWTYLSGDDDFAPYKKYADQVNISLNKNPYILSQIEDEMNSIVNKHEKEMIFKRAEYNFYQDGSEILLLYYNKLKNNVSVNIEVQIDVKRAIITEIAYEKGSSKRVGGALSEKMGPIKEIPVQEAYNDFLANNTYEPDDENIFIQIVYEYEGIIITTCEKRELGSREIFEYIYKEPEYP